MFWDVTVRGWDLGPVPPRLGADESKCSSRPRLLGCTLRGYDPVVSFNDGCSLCMKMVSTIFNNAFWAGLCKISKFSSVPTCFDCMMCLAMPDDICLVLFPVRAETPKCSKILVLKWRVVHPM